MTQLCHIEFLLIVIVQILAINFRWSNCIGTFLNNVIFNKYCCFERRPCLRKYIYKNIQTDSAILVKTTWSKLNLISQLQFQWKILLKLLLINDYQQKILQRHLSLIWANFEEIPLFEHSTIPFSLIRCLIIFAKHVLQWNNTVSKETLWPSFPCVYEKCIAITYENIWPAWRILLKHISWERFEKPHNTSTLLVVKFLI